MSSLRQVSGFHNNSDPLSSNLGKFGWSPFTSIQLLKEIIKFCFFFLTKYWRNNYHIYGCYCSRVLSGNPSFGWLKVSMSVNWLKFGIQAQHYITFYWDDYLASPHLPSSMTVDS